MITIPSLAAMSRIKDPGKYYCSENGREYAISPGGGINDGLVSHWSMHNTTSAIVPSDFNDTYIGTNGGGLIPNSGYMTGVALTTSYFSFPTITFNANWSISFSITRDVGGTIVIISDNVQLSYVYLTNSSLSIRMNGGTTSQGEYIGGSQVTFTEFNTYTISCTNSVVSFYVNGTLMKNWNPEIVAPSFNVQRVGNYGVTGGNAHVGKIKNVRFHNKGLTPGEVQELYKEGL